MAKARKSGPKMAKIKRSSKRALPKKVSGCSMKKAGATVIVACNSTPQLDSAKKALRAKKGAKKAPKKAAKKSAKKTAKKGAKKTAKKGAKKSAKK